MNVRELCSLLSATLHTPGVERYAARLVRRGLLPRAGCEIYTLDAALLLMAVVAAPRPADAPRVVATLAGLPLAFVERKVGSAKFPTWVPGDDDDVAAMFSDPPPEGTTTAPETGTRTDGPLSGAAPMADVR